MTLAATVGHHSGQSIYFVDADEILPVASEQPFESGLLPIDPAATVVVTNWWPDEHASTAPAELLLRIVGRDTVPDTDDDGNLVFPAADPLSGSPSVSALRQIYARLRRSDGCPWDREQTELATLPHIIEETEELREALKREDWNQAAEELGDILGNIMMIAQIATERGAFTFEDVVASISSKLVRRHPHVFGDKTAASADEVLGIWNAVKQQERDERNESAHTAVEASEST